MKRHLVLVVSGVLAFVSCAATVRAQPGPPHEIYVDDSAPEGGDGSAEWPVRTIQEGIALVPPPGGTVYIHPGTYIGPILVERDDVTLWGLAEPIYDPEAFLEGFVEEVVIAMDRPLEADDLENRVQVEDVVELRGSGNEVHNLVVDAHRAGVTVWSSAFSAKAEDDDFYDDIVFSHLLVRGVIDNTVWTAKANARIEYVTSLDSGAVGISAVANGHVDLAKSHIARKGINVCYVGIWEAPGEENGPSFLTGSVRDCRLRDATGSFQTQTDEGPGLFVFHRAGPARSNGNETSTIILEVTGNAFEGNKRGVRIVPNSQEWSFDTAETLFCLQFSGNEYVANSQDVAVRFRASRTDDSYANDATLIVEDGDGVFPDPADVDLGPPENNNVYELITP